MVYQYCDNLGIDYHNNPSMPYDIIFFWSYTKTTTVQDDFIKKSPRVINRGCYDVTKSRVEEIFNTGIFINPEIHEGECVRKSQSQAAHDGVVIKCPHKPEEGFIYQQIIDTKNGRGNYIHYRVFYSGQIDYVLKKESSDMFDVDNSLVSVEMIELKEVFSRHQIKYINDKCKLFGLDFGELDVLKDAGNEIYVIDVNNVAGRENYQPSKLMSDKYRKCFINFLKRRANG